MEGVGEGEGVREGVRVASCDGVGEPEPDWDGVGLTVTVTVWVTVCVTVNTCVEDCELDTLDSWLPVAEAVRVALGVVDSLLDSLAELDGVCDSDCDAVALCERVRVCVWESVPACDRVWVCVSEAVCDCERVPVPVAVGDWLGLPVSLLDPDPLGEGDCERVPEALELRVCVRVRLWEPVVVALRRVGGRR